MTGSGLNIYISIIYAYREELIRQRNLKLEALFWGYRNLLEQFEYTCLPHLRECYLQSLTPIGSGGYANVFQMQDRGKTYALKMPRMHDWKV